jgi:MoxR-like ATPase
VGRRLEIGDPDRRGLWIEHHHALGGWPQRSANRHEEAADRSRVTVGTVQERSDCGRASSVPAGRTAPSASTLSNVTDTARSTTSFATLFDSLVGNIATVVQGKREAIEFSVMALLAEGHLLIEDVPGVGKTSLAKALAGSIDCSWKRIQFTPDLLPTDLVGVSVYERSSEQFRFQPGPLFANIVLADEINRASPKTQSALLESMEERQVTADGTTHRLPPPFMVIATQNPVEQEGTYRLPESQLDRFLLRISLGYPGRTAEMAILDNMGAADTLRELEPVLSSQEVLAMVRSVREVYLASALKSYMVDISEASRRHSAIELGLSPRATLQLAAAVRAHAAANGRDYGTPDDVKAVAVSVLAHRLLLRAGSNARTSSEDSVRELLADVPVPIAR